MIRNINILGAFAAIALCLPQLAMAQDRTDQNADNLRILLRTDPTTIQIADDKKSDLSSCDASEGAALITALNNCWPILQAFQKYRANKKDAQSAVLAINKTVRADPTIRGTDAHKDMKDKAMADIFQSAQELYDLAKARDYPLQDMLLFLANLTRISQIGVTGDYKTGLRYLEDNIRIMETTKMTEPGFVTLDALYKQKARYLKYLAEQAKAGNP